MNIEDKIKKGREEFIADGGDWNEKFQELSTRLDEGKRKESKRSIKLIGLVIALLLLASLIFFQFFQPEKKSNPEQIFLAYYQPAVPLFEKSTRGNAEVQTKTHLSLGNEAYLNGDFQKAYDQWKLTVTEQSTDEVKTFFGITALHLNKPEEAISSLSNVKDKEFQDLAQWYLSLALIKLGHQEQSKNVLKNIANDKSHFKSIQAGEILDLLG